MGRNIFKIMHLFYTYIRAQCGAPTDINIQEEYDDDMTECIINTTIGFLCKHAHINVISLTYMISLKKISVRITVGFDLVLKTKLAYTIFCLANNSTKLFTFI